MTTPYNAPTGPAITPAPLLSYYGDDLTGSTDVMEALSSRGVPTALFLDIPTAAQAARVGPVRAIGIAGSSRSETPAWMEAHLRPALEWLKGLGAAICHYKVCSTFDSSPTVGSIGKALDIGAALFARQTTVPLVVGAPQLKRYTAFGHLFANYQGRGYRIDRHPVMSRHPVTPMREADIGLHLAAQTSRGFALVDLADLQASDRTARVDAALAREPGVLLFDVADPASQAAVGRELWRVLRDVRTFTVGSSGLEYALLAEWERLGIVPGHTTFASPGAVDRIAAVSGSCSPTTERQIRHALEHGFEGIALDPRDLIAATPTDLEGYVAQGLTVLEAGRSVIFYSALGPETDLERGVDGGRHAIGQALGVILRRLIETTKLSRVVIAGGDTSSHAARQLDLYALTTRLPLPQTPGSPLCTGFSGKPGFDGLEIAFKGGQVGDDEYFSAIRDGSV